MYTEHESELTTLQQLMARSIAVPQRGTTKGYQWSTTAGSASSRERCLMDGQLDTVFYTVPPHNSPHDI